MLSWLVRNRVVVIGVAAVVLIAGALLSERSRRADVPVMESPAIRVRGKLGPTPGPDADGYVAQKQAYLRQVAGSSPGTAAAALVSLAQFLTPAQTVSVVNGLRLDVVFVRPPEGSPEVLPVEGTLDVTVGSWSQRTAAALEAEAGQSEGLAKTAPAADRRSYLQDASAKRAAAGTMLRGCSCVYAVVVGGGTLASLQSLAANPAVRLVDVADPPVADLRGWELTPILSKG